MLGRFEQFSSSIASISKNIQKIERTEMARYGLKGAHVQCLMAMRRHTQGIILSQLCEVCEKDKAAISRAVAELEAKGLVERWTAGEKIYRAPLRLTEAGSEIAGRIVGIAERAVELAGEGLADEDRRVFYQALELIAGNLQRISRDGIPEIKEERNQNQYEG